MFQFVPTAPSSSSSGWRVLEMWHSVFLESLSAVRQRERRSALKQLPGRGAWSTKLLPVP